MSVLHKSAIWILSSKTVLKNKLIYFISVTLQRGCHVHIIFQYFVTQGLTGNTRSFPQCFTFSLKKPGSILKIINLHPSGREGGTESYANYCYMDCNTYPEILCRGKFSITARNKLKGNNAAKMRQLLRQ
jgi:hypothetical protein